MAEKILKTNAAADYLGVSRSSLTNWVKQGLISGGVTPGGHYRFTVEELNSFAQKRGLDIPQMISSGRAVKILLIEDDEGFREFVKDALEIFSGFELKEAFDGMQGALLVGTWKPNLIILDIRMPNMNGIELLKMLRANPDTASIKVIIASAHISEEVSAEMDHLGVEVVMNKPVRLAKLVAAIEKCASLKLN